jgi:hypothetical protein
MVQERLPRKKLVWPNPEHAANSANQAMET